MGASTHEVYRFNEERDSILSKELIDGYVKVAIIYVRSSRSHTQYSHSHFFGNFFAPQSTGSDSKVWYLYTACKTLPNKSRVPNGMATLDPVAYSGNFNRLLAEGRLAHVEHICKTGLFLITTNSANNEERKTFQ